MGGLVALLIAGAIVAIFYFAKRVDSEEKPTGNSPFANTPTDVLQSHVFSLAKKQTKLSGELADITADFQASDMVVEQGKRLRIKYESICSEYDAAKAELERRRDSTR